MPRFSKHETGKGPDPASLVSRVCPLCSRALAGGRDPVLAGPLAPASLPLALASWHDLGCCPPAVRGGRHQGGLSVELTSELGWA